MPLRYRIQSDPETIQDLELASEEKYWEGVELLAAGRRGGGIYLLGYAAEMILKNACFVFDGARPADPVSLGPVGSFGNRYLPTIGRESYHSLWFWLHVLLAKRHRKGRSLAHQLDAPLVQRTRRIYGIWTVEMRYQPDRSMESEGRCVYDDVTWIRDHRHELMR
jgi:hypothetical protein